MGQHASDHVGPPYEMLAVTADPAEGEAFTDAGNNLVEAVPMPPEIADIVGRFVATHHVERPFVKRQRNRQTSLLQNPPGTTSDE